MIYKFASEASLFFRYHYSKLGGTDIKMEFIEGGVRMDGFVDLIHGGRVSMKAPEI